MYNLLAYKIVVCAIQDYKAIMRKLKMYPSNEKVLKDKISIEKFFLSEWFEQLSEADGKAILRNLQIACK